MDKINLGICALVVANVASCLSASDNERLAAEAQAVTTGNKCGGSQGCCYRLSQDQRGISTVAQYDKVISCTSVTGDVFVSTYQELVSKMCEKTNLVCDKNIFSNISQQ